MEITTIKIGMFEMLAVVVLTVYLGQWIRNKLPILKKYCIPDAVVGGTLVSIVTCVLYMTGIVNFEWENYTVMNNFFYNIFFAASGTAASLALLKKGGKLVLIFSILAAVLAVIQNAVALGLGVAMGMNPLTALMAGSTPLTGGHGNAASFGPIAAEMGGVGAVEVAVAAATFGLISAVLLGGPLARKLITKYDLKPDENDNFSIDVSDINSSKGEALSGLDIIKNVTVIVACMAIGTIVSGWIGKLINMSFPNYVGAMFVAVLVRNLNEKFKWYNFSFGLVDGIGDVMLNLYLGIALMSLKLWELAGLIGGVLVVVLCQVVFMALIAYFVVFRILGKNYDAAVMCAGLCGHGLGATPSAIVNMTAVKDQYGMSRKAFMIVPIVGAFLVDIIYQPQTIAFIKFFVQGFNG